MMALSIADFKIICENYMCKINRKIKYNTLKQLAR